MKWGLVTTVLIILKCYKVQIASLSCKTGQTMRYDSLGNNICCHTVICYPSEMIRLCTSDQGFDTCYPCSEGTYHMDKINTADLSDPLDPCIPMPTCESLEVIMKDGRCVCNRAQGFYGEDPNNCVLAEAMCASPGLELKNNGKCGACGSEFYKPEASHEYICRPKAKCSTFEIIISNGSTTTDRLCGEHKVLPTTMRQLLTENQKASNSTDRLNEPNMGIMLMVIVVLVILVLLVVFVKIVKKSFNTKLNGKSYRTQRSPILRENAYSQQEVDNGCDAILISDVSIITPTETDTLVSIPVIVERKVTEDDDVNVVCVVTRGNEEGKTLEDTNKTCLSQTRLQQSRDISIATESKQTNKNKAKRINNNLEGEEKLGLKSQKGNNIQDEHISARQNVQTAMEKTGRSIYVETSPHSPKRFIDDSTYYSCVSTKSPDVSADFDEDDAFLKSDDNSSKCSDLSKRLRDKKTKSRDILTISRAVITQSFDNSFISNTHLKSNMSKDIKECYNTNEKTPTSTAGLVLIEEPTNPDFINIRRVNNLTCIQKNKIEEPEKEKSHDIKGEPQEPEICLGKSIPWKDRKRITHDSAKTERSTTENDLSSDYETANEDSEPG